MEGGQTLVEFSQSEQPGRAQVARDLAVGALAVGAIAVGAELVGLDRILQQPDVSGQGALAQPTQQRSPDPSVGIETPRFRADVVVALKDGVAQPRVARRDHRQRRGDRLSRPGAPQERQPLVSAHRRSVKRVAEQRQVPWQTGHSQPSRRLSR